MRLITGAVAVWLAWVGSWLEPIPSSLLTLAALLLALWMVFQVLRGIGEG